MLFLGGFCLSACARKEQALYVTGLLDRPVAGQLVVS